MIEHIRSDLAEALQAYAKARRAWTEADIAERRARAEMNGIAAKWRTLQRTLRVYGTEGEDY